MAQSQLSAALGRVVDALKGAGVYLIGNDRGGRLSIEELGKLLDHALTVLTLDEPARMVVATPPGLGAPVPALLITTTTD